jgi:trimethylguanosine synthase
MSWSPHRSPGPNRGGPRRASSVADLAIILNRVDLYDIPRQQAAQQQQPPHEDYQAAVEAFTFEPPAVHAPAKLSRGRVAITRVPPEAVEEAAPVVEHLVVMDNRVPNPYGPSIDKYWKQRRRLFSRFDDGIQLDEEGWFSVTPEIIADHVAQRLTALPIAPAQEESQEPETLIVLDAFCGCGGNSIAFAKQPNVMVIATDVDRSKLRRAAHNASIYQIPPDKIVFIECNVLFLLEFCFRDGHYVLDQPVATPAHIDALLAAMPPPVATETVAGYSIGGIDLLPRKIDAVFMDPPWGGVDYEVLGKRGYCLEKNMRIKRPVGVATPPAAAGAVGDDFFDTFAPQTAHERKSNFNVGLDESTYANGVEVLRLAATATARRWVIYDIPRNTNRSSLGGAALAAGYRGNLKLDGRFPVKRGVAPWSFSPQSLTHHSYPLTHSAEHYLNGRLKTVTAYMGTDWTHLMKNYE